MDNETFNCKKSLNFLTLIFKPLANFQNIRNFEKLYQTCI